MEGLSLPVGDLPRRGQESTSALCRTTNRLSNELIGGQLTGAIRPDTLTNR